MPVLRYLDLSTAHLTQREAEEVCGLGPSSQYVMGDLDHSPRVVSHEYGAWVNVPALDETTDEQDHARAGRGTPEPRRLHRPSPRAGLHLDQLRPGRGHRARPADLRLVTAMPYVVNSGRAIVTPPHDHAERVPWSVLASDVGAELRWDPPTQEGDYLHAAQRAELEAVLAAWNAKHG